ncbi:MAG: DNA polymerase III subunit delta [bacterium]
MVIFLYGKNNFLAKRRLTELKQAFKAKYDQQGLNMITLEADKLNVARLNESLGTQSMFNPKVFLVIDGLMSSKNEALFESIEVYLRSQIAGDNVVVVIDEFEIKKDKGAFKGKQVVKKSVDFKKRLLEFLVAQPHSKEYVGLLPKELLDWLKREASINKVNISLEAAQLLIALTGGDMWQLANEIHKLASYKLGQSQNIIEVIDVKTLVQGIFEDKIFALMDAISQRDRAKALKLFNDGLQGGQSAEYLFSMILRQFRVLLMVKQAVEVGQNQTSISADLKIHSFVVQKALVQVKNFSLESLKNIFGYLVQIEYRWKTGQGDVATSLDLLIAKL